MFHKVPAGAIETLFDDQNQPLFKRADLGKYLGIEDIRQTFKDFPYTRLRSDMEARGRDPSLRKAKNPHDIFINLDGSIEVAVRSKKPKEVALVKWLTKKGTEKLQEEHQKAITGHDNQIQALELANEKHQQKMLRLNEEIDDLIKNRQVPCRGYFDNVLCFIEKSSKEVHPYHVIRGQYRQLEKYKKCLKLHYSSMEEVGRCDDPNAIHRWNIFKSEVIEKPNYYKNYFSLTEEKRELLETVLDVTFKIKDFCTEKYQMSSIHQIL